MPWGVHGEPTVVVAQDRVLLPDWTACVVSRTWAVPPWYPVDNVVGSFTEMLNATLALVSALVLISSLSSS